MNRSPVERVMLYSKPIPSCANEVEDLKDIAGFDFASVFVEDISPNNPIHRILPGGD